MVIGKDTIFFATAELTTLVYNEGMSSLLSLDVYRLVRKWLKYLLYFQILWIADLSSKMLRTRITWMIPDRSITIIWTVDLENNESTVGCALNLHDRNLGL